MRKYIGCALLTVAAATLVVWLISSFVQPLLPGDINSGVVLFFVALVAVLGGLAAFKDAVELMQMILGRSSSKPEPGTSNATVTLFSPNCGDRGIDLANERYLLSSAFGTYFTGLLESDANYVNLRGQIDLPGSVTPHGLDPLQSVFWELQRSKGPRAFILAADGGMGKSTLAAKIIKCLRNEDAIDMILGDSAKTEEVNPITGAVTSLDPAYYSPDSFFERLCRQLGLPYTHGKTSHQKALQLIQDRLEGRRALIVADNLENVARNTELLRTIVTLATRDTRVVVTTRNIAGLDSAGNVLVAYLRPIKNWDDAREFMLWHIRTHAREHPDLSKLESSIEDRAQIQKLLERTGGVPLLIQLVASDIARSSWKTIENMPAVFGKKLLDFLYRERWKELERLGQEGDQARGLLLFVSEEQYRGKKITFDRVKEWADESESQVVPQSSLRLLQERFMIVNHDPKEGSFAVFPSLAQFLRQQST